MSDANVNLDVGNVLTVFSNLKGNPEAAKRVEEILKLILNREGFMPADLEAILLPLISRVEVLISQYQTTQQTIGDLMADIKDVGSKVDSLDASAKKSFAEIRKALDDAMASTITPEEMKTAVDSAIAATTASERTAAQAALDPIMDKLTTLEDSLKKLDDVVPDTSQSPVAQPTQPPTPVPPPEETL